MNYYFLTSLLPSLEIGHPPRMPMDQLLPFLQEGLGKEDFEKVRVILQLVDLENLRRILLNRSFFLPGNYSQKEWKEILSRPQEVKEETLEAFLVQNDSLEKRLKNFPELFHQYFWENGKKEEGFLKAYLQFEREWRLVMVALRAKKWGKDLREELQYEDGEDSFVAYLLATKEGGYEPQAEYLPLKTFLDQVEDPLELEKKVLKYRFEKIKSLGEEKGGFSIDVILSYVARVLVLEEWLLSSDEKGNQWIKTIEHEVNECL